MLNKILVVVFLLLLSVLQTPTNILAQEKTVSRAEFPYDKRAVILRAYLEKYNSPLADNAQDFVDSADKYNLDWKFVAAISGVESTFGKFVPGGLDPRYTSYNGWGWGVYGTQAIYFKSWKEAIYAVSEGLRKNYFDKGLTEPYAINRKYAESKTWGASVSYFLTDMEKFAEKYSAENIPAVEIDVKVDVAGDSGSLTNPS